MDVLMKILFLAVKLSLIKTTYYCKGHRHLLLVEVQNSAAHLGLVWSRLFKELDKSRLTHATSGNLSQGKNSK